VTYADATKKHSKAFSTKATQNKPTTAHSKKPETRIILKRNIWIKSIAAIL
jgi:hypothetical protein